MTRYLHSGVEPAVRVRCLRCRHETRLSESRLRNYGVSSGAPIASYVKRLRCKKCGSQSLEASQVEMPAPILLSETRLVRVRTAATHAENEKPQLAGAHHPET